MSLLDALLLDPPRIDVWVAYRSTVTSPASVQGSGTQNDPFTVNSAADFDKLMNDANLIPVNTCVHLGPGTFQTTGYKDGGGAGWQIRTGVRIVGSGIDVTKLQIAGNSTSATFYAIGHTLSATTVDFCEVSDLTIDCNKTALTGTTAAAGAVRIMGNHSRVVRVKVINWGSNSASLSFVIGMLTGNGTTNPNAVVNCGIQECVVLSPVAGGVTGGNIAVLHIGASEAQSGTTGNGIGGYIRDCFVDCGQTIGNAATDKFYRALSMSWCKAGVVEGNQVHNTFYGGPYSTLPAEGITVRDNTYRNVATGPFYGLGSAGTMKILIEGNQIELTTVSVNPIIPDATRFALGVILYNNTNGTGGPIPYSSVILRSNRIWYLDDGVPSTNPGSGTYIVGASNLLVRENMLQLTATNPLRNRDCGSVQYFENRARSGGLVQGVREITSTTQDLIYTELATDADDAFMLSLLLKR